MKEITNQTYVVATHYSGSYYINKEKADALVRLIEGDQTTRFVKIAESYVRVDDIRTIATAAQMEAKRHEDAGDVQCKHGTWHGRNDKCQCYLVKSK